jgi:hypothetical protein
LRGAKAGKIIRVGIDAKPTDAAVNTSGPPTRWRASGMAAAVDRDEVSREWKGCRDGAKEAQKEIRPLP